MGMRLKCVTLPAEASVNPEIQSWARRLLGCGLRSIYMAPPLGDTRRVLTAFALVRNAGKGFHIVDDPRLRLTALFQPTGSASIFRNHRRQTADQIKTHAGEPLGPLRPA